MVDKQQEDKLGMVRDWIDDGLAPDDFNDDFICSLEVSYERWSELTPAQEGALDNIIKSYKIEEE